MTGTGNIDEAVTGGSFEIDLQASIIKKTYTGDICQAKTFDMPMGLGSVTWNGMKCPLAAGAQNVGTSIMISGSLPASMAKAAIQIKATGANGDSLLCMKMTTAPAESSAVVV